MAENPLLALGRLGQSVWLDFITRQLVRGGELARLIREDGLRGMTSNPTIFEKALASGSDYDADIRRLLEGELPAASIFEALTVADVQGACDLFAPVYQASDGRDGLVSIEVSPTVAHDTAGTIAEAERLWREVGRANAMIKIPGTKAGLPAISRCIAQGININVTLLFSVTRYEEVIDAYCQGLEQRVASGQPLSRLASVASFFVSRVDSRLDPVLDAAGDPLALRGKGAIANAGTAYTVFQRSLTTPRWGRLAAEGAQPQRPLWASTSTKDPRYPDVYYVEALIARDTVNTVPPDTLNAYRDHGRPTLRIAEAMATAPRILAALRDQGIDLAAVTTFLEEDGVQKFAASYHAVLARIEAKTEALATK